ncbi:MAG: YlxR family protein [Anaerolineales bacterium]|nr:YlxR family protein [Anaerolineales bacterium]
MIRVARTPDGVQVDPSGKLPGRGAYLHDLRSCWQQGLKGALAHALKTEITAEERELLAAYMQSLPDTNAAEPVSEGQSDRPKTPNE